MQLRQPLKSESLLRSCDFDESANQHHLTLHWCSTFVELEDLQVFLPEEQARDALDAFDCDADGHISSDDMREAVLQVCALLLLCL